MSWNEHSDLRGQHALFSPSNPSWLNYDNDIFLERLNGKYRANIGTELHEWAAIQIELGNKVSSKRELIKSFKSFLYQKYHTDKYGLSKFGSKLLKSIKCVPAESFASIISYVNDAIGFKMEPEVILYYSDNFFGTSDAVKFVGNTLYIFDLKTGSSATHIEQLLIYAALYCLEHKENPYKINMELRIYQGNDILIANPVGDDVKPVMDKIIEFDELITKFEGGAEL